MSKEIIQCHLCKKYIPKSFCLTIGYSKENPNETLHWCNYSNNHITINHWKKHKEIIDKGFKKVLKNINSNNRKAKKTSKKTVLKP